ncbi:MAG: hypothetical protein KJO31_09350 [Gammaproteobacteria bacterium]|nr:hypothetical protein [Gammaproteobacteria bacterium]
MTVFVAGATELARTRAKPGIYQTTTLVAVVVFVVIIFVIAGYFLIAPKPRSAMLEELRDQRLRWDRQAPAAFSYVVDPACVCAPIEDAPYEVLELNGQRTARFLDLSHATSGADDAGPENILSIADAFALAEAGVAGASHITIDYHRLHGFPTDVMIHWSGSDADDHEGFRIYEFRVVGE